VARNRKRARDRRPGQPGTPVDPSQGLPTATHRFDNGDAELEDQNGAPELEDENGAPELEAVDIGSESFEDGPGAGAEVTSDESDDQGADDERDEYAGAPAPLEHAMPDAELAEEQLEFARPAEPEPGDEEDEEEFEREVEDSISERGGRGRRRRGGYDGGGGSGGSGGGGELVAPGAGRGAAVAEREPNIITRLIGFLQGSWRELQRVQWPDRRQVMQATGVVIGFVIIAAVFLGVSDWVSQKIVTFVLK
jgi:preprotein translocase subunit SecE